MERRKLSLNQQLIEVDLNNLTRPPEASAPVTMRRLEVLKSLECPVCYEQIFPPVRDCTNGHHTCSACLAKISKCPLCKQPAGITQNRFAEDFLDKYVQRCANQGQGCQIFYWKEEEGSLRAHEKSCKFRKLQCWVPNCKTLMSLTSLYDHWGQEHSIMKVRDEVIHDFLLDKNSSDYHAMAFRLEYDGHTFLTIFERCTGALFYTYGYCPFEVLPHYEASIKLQISIKNSNGKVRSEGTHYWAGPICQDMEDPQEIKAKNKDWYKKLPSIDEKDNCQLLCHTTIKITSQSKESNGGNTFGFPAIYPVPPGS